MPFSSNRIPVVSFANLTASPSWLVLASLFSVSSRKRNKTSGEQEISDRHRSGDGQNFLRFTMKKKPCLSLLECLAPSIFDFNERTDIEFLKWVNQFDGWKKDALLFVKSVADSIYFSINNQNKSPEDAAKTGIWEALDAMYKKQKSQNGKGP